MMERGLKVVLDVALKIANHIKFWPFNASILTLFCNDMASEHTTLLLYTEIRRLSRKKFVSVFELCSEVYSFLLITLLSFSQFGKYSLAAEIGILMIHFYKN
jgi:hypothetical protein